jgi:multiple sugar transport system permease protein
MTTLLARRVQTPPHRTPRHRRQVGSQVVLGLLMVYFLLPFWWIVVNASKNASGLFAGGSALWFATDIDYVGNFRQLFTFNGGIYARWLVNLDLSSGWGVRVARGSVVTFGSDSGVWV